MVRLFFWYVGPEAAQRLPVAMEAPHLLIGGLEVADPGTPHPPRDVEFTNFSTMFPSQAYPGSSSLVPTPKQIVCANGAHARKQRWRRRVGSRQRENAQHQGEKQGLSQ